MTLVQNSTQLHQNLRIGSHVWSRANRKRKPVLITSAFLIQWLYTTRNRVLSWIFELILIRDSTQLMCTVLDFPCCKHYGCIIIWLTRVSDRALDVRLWRSNVLSAAAFIVTHRAEHNWISNIILLVTLIAKWNQHFLKSKYDEKPEVIAGWSIHTTSALFYT